MRAVDSIDIGSVEVDGRAACAGARRDGVDLCWHVRESKVISGVAKNWRRKVGDISDFVSGRKRIWRGVQIRDLAVLGYKICRFVGIYKGCGSVLGRPPSKDGPSACLSLVV